MMSSTRWIKALADVEKSGQAWVMATVIGTHGSAPRESSSKMIITENHSFDTIGGGQLEYLVCEKARQMLKDSSPPSHTMEHFPLSAKANQCCGGRVNVLFEYFAAPNCNITLFGMGHVASTLVTILGEMDATVAWVDSRESLANDKSETALPQNVKTHLYSSMLEHIENMPANAIALIMTHDHALDYQLVEALLDRKDCRFIGLIGSKTKALRFRKRLASASFSEAEINSVHCPVGSPYVKGKKPFEISISIAAQLLDIVNAPATDNTGCGEKNSSAKNSNEKNSSGLSWRDITHALNTSTNSTSTDSTSTNSTTANSNSNPSNPLERV